jgi:hypothetical protein
VIRGKERTLSSRRFCLTCSPFGARNTRRLHEAEASSKWCTRCQRELPRDAFYPRRDREGLTPYCRECYREIDHFRQRKIKGALVDAAGGRCTRCGYSRCLAALEFHHRDPSEKDPQLFRNKHRRARVTEETKAELRKCDLVCSNCHREVHEEQHLPPPGAIE